MINTITLQSYLAKIAIKQGKPIPTLVDIESALMNKNETELIQSCRARIEAQLWDGISNINSATAEYIRESNPWLDVVYVLLIDGQAIYMQTHDPFQEGWVPITQETVDQISNAHANQIAEELASNEIVQQILVEFNLTSN